MIMGCRRGYKDREEQPDGSSQVAAQGLKRVTVLFRPLAECFRESVNQPKQDKYVRVNPVDDFADIVVVTL